MQFDSYVLKFNFPLRVNDKKPLACTSMSGFVYGDAYYHENLRTIICKLVKSSVPANPIPSSATMKISGFYTPWYLLSPLELKVYAIATYHSSSDSEYISYFDFFPLLNPRYTIYPPSTARSSFFTLTEILPHTIACQRNDYVFKIKLENIAGPSLNLNLQYTKMIMISFPLSTVLDYSFYSTDCFEHSSSTV